MHQGHIFCLLTLPLPVWEWSASNRKCEFPTWISPPTSRLIHSMFLLKCILGCTISSISTQPYLTCDPRPPSTNSHLLSHLMWALCYASFGPRCLGVPFHHLFPSHLLPVIRLSSSVHFNISLESGPFLLWLRLLSWQVWKSFLAWTSALGNKHCNRWATVHGVVNRHDWICTHCMW